MMPNTPPKDPPKTGPTHVVQNQPPAPTTTVVCREPTWWERYGAIGIAAVVAFSFVELFKWGVRTVAARTKTKANPDQLALPPGLPDGARMIYTWDPPAEPDVLPPAFRANLGPSINPGPPRSLRDLAAGEMPPWFAAHAAEQDAWRKSVEARLGIGPVANPEPDEPAGRRRGGRGR
jgi:hypothetical protein